MKKLLIVAIALIGLCGLLSAKAQVVRFPGYFGTVVASGSSPTPDIAWYKLNEGSGTAVGDSSTRGTNGLTLQTSSMWTSLGGFTVPQGGAGRFATNFPTLNPVTNTITVTAWIYVPSFPSTKILFECASGPSTADNSWFVWLGASTVEAGIFGGGGYRYETFASPSVNTWHHIGIVFDNTSNTAALKMYLDGSPQSTTVVLNTKTTAAQFAAAQLWAWARSGPNSESDAGMDDIRIYSGDRSANMAAIYGDRQ